MDIKKLSELLKLKKEQLIFLGGIVIVLIIVLLYNFYSQKKVNPDSEVNFVQSFYALQFGDTLGAPKMLNDLYIRNKNNTLGFWSGLALADYYYKLQKDDNAFSIVRNIKSSDEIGNVALKVLRADLKISKGDIKGAISELNVKTNFNSLNDYVKYRKAKILLSIEKEKEAIELLKELSNRKGIFSELAKEELRKLGQKL
ncbi:MAG: hypothetical protein N2504_06270 [candidate division WOR-3 bacterium]|nr:hypothetical protein [candidate division WOR-3 bacterium]MCX7948173.1 hypothetical protein [candidate division WOR-3 bacterium]MDW8151131.1 hypothetical protein [candidate division WOR-3 bacterium]